MTQQDPKNKLEKLLQELARRISFDFPVDHSEVAIPLNLNEVEAWLTVDSPPIFDVLDPERVGLAFVDETGDVRASWGIAHRIPSFGRDLKELLRESSTGTTGSVFWNGYRVFASPYGSAPLSVLFFADAGEEARIREEVTEARLAVHVLSKMGRVLTSHQSLAPLLSGAVHELASSCQLAAALIWVSPDEHLEFDLSASVGANREGTSILSRLRVQNECTCLPELSASMVREFYVADVHENRMTCDLEARFCYLEPGPLMALPLVMGDQLLGVLEVIGRKGEEFSEAQQSLFRTLAEHVALAVNSARLYEATERLATHDPLTGIPNHRALQDFLHRQVAEALRSGKSLAVAMLDVDHFRAFNEEEGHDVGDEVLKKVGECLRGSVRLYDLVARYGGEEFTIVMPGADRESASLICDRVRKRIAEISIQTVSGGQRGVTASLGVSILPENAREPVALLKAADLALYESKRAGRNRVTFYHGTLSGFRGTEPDMDFDLLRAWLSAEQLELAQARRSVTDAWVDHLAGVHGLSDRQVSMLKALTMVYEVYEDTLSQADVKHLVAMEESTEFQPIWPVLQCFRDRYDEYQDSIPLLARMLNAVVSLYDQGEFGYMADPERFDPALTVSLFEMDLAA